MLSVTSHSKGLAGLPLGGTAMPYCFTFLMMMVVVVVIIIIIIIVIIIIAFLGFHMSLLGLNSLCSGG